jgi:hypothetical protein
MGERKIWYETESTGIGCIVRKGMDIKAEKRIGRMKAEEMS